MCTAAVAKRENVSFVIGEDQMTLDNEQRIWEVVKNRAWLEYTFIDNTVKSCNFQAGLPDSSSTGVDSATACTVVA